MTTEFKHKHHIQLRLKDIDNMQHVNHANYLSFVELARLKYYDDILGTNTEWHSQQGQIMARTEIDYKDALEYDDSVTVYTRCTKLGTKSFELSWIITKSSDHKQEKIAAKGKSIIVCYDYKLKMAIEIPNDYKLKIQQFEGKL